MSSISKDLSDRVACPEENCSDCQGVIVRTYDELMDSGVSDRNAYLSAVRVLKLRHPGHEPNYYFLQVAQWLGGKRLPETTR